MRIRIFTSFFIFFALFMCSNLVLAQEAELIYEQCFMNKTQGKYTGYTCVSQNKVIEEGKTFVNTSKNITMKFKRNDNVIAVDQEEFFKEDLDGSPVSFKIKKKSSGETFEINGNFVSSDTINVSYDINSIKNTKTINIDKKILFPFAIENLYKSSNNSYIEYATLEPGLDLRVLEVNAEKVGQDNLSESSIDGEYTKYKVEYNILPNIENYDWRDKAGKLVKSQTSLFNMEEIAVDKSQLKELTADFDIFSQSFIPVNKEINNIESIDNATLKISADGVPPLGIFVNSERQRIIQTTQDATFIKVKGENLPDKYYPYPFSVVGYKDYLKSGPYIITDSIKVREIAENISKGETNAFKLAKKFEKWVYNNIQHKDLSTDFANTLKILETKSGDCTEHSVLLASLLRSVGIPSTVVVGLVYTDSPQPAFVYHMWVKAYIGKWINLDPSFPYETFSAFHLEMAESTLNDFSDKGNINLKVLESIQKLEIQILNAAKPVIAAIGDSPSVKINLDNSLQESVNTSITGVQLKKKSEINNEMQEITLPNNREENYIRTAYYHYSKGDLHLAKKDFEKYYSQISSDDDYSKVRLALKLIGLGFLNFADSVLSEVQDLDIWQQELDEISLLYMPKNIPDIYQEMNLAKALYKFNIENDFSDLFSLSEDMPGSDFINHARAKVFMKKEDYASAEKELTYAVKKNPENITYKLDFIKVHIAENDVIKATKEINSLKIIAKRKNVSNKTFWSSLNAQENWLQVKQNREIPVQSKYYMAKYYAAKGDYKTASDILYKLVSIYDKPYINEFQADIYYQLGNYEEAKNNYNTAVQMSPNMWQSLFGLGNISFIKGNSLQALEYYLEASKVSPKNTDVLIAIAKTYNDLGKPEIANTYYKKVLEIDNDNPEVLYNIGLRLIQKNDIERSEIFLKRAISKNPLESLIWVDLAKVSILKEDYKTALRYLSSVWHIDEMNPFFYYYTGVVLERVGNSAESEKFLQKALELKPDLVNDLKKSKENL